MRFEIGKKIDNKACYLGRDGYNFEIVTTGGGCQESFTIKALTEDEMLDLVATLRYIREKVTRDIEYAIENLEQAKRLEEYIRILNYWPTHEDAFGIDYYNDLVDWVVTYTDSHGESFEVKFIDTLQEHVAKRYKHLRYSGTLEFCGDAVENVIENLEPNQRLVSVSYVTISPLNYAVYIIVEQ